MLISTSLVSLGTYARFLFGGKKYTLAQKIVLLLMGFAIVFILSLTEMDVIYQTSISLVAGLLLPNVVNTVIKAGEKSEEKASDNISNQVDKFTK